MSRRCLKADVPWRRQSEDELGGADPRPVEEVTHPIVSLLARDLSNHLAATADAEGAAICTSRTNEMDYVLSALFSRAMRLDVSQRPPPIFCTSE